LAVNITADLSNHQSQHPAVVNNNKRKEN
jgi:hypothetical protein